MFHENIFYQHEQGLLTDDVCRSWEVDLEYTLKHQNINALKSKVSDLFPGKFGKMSQEIIDGKLTLK